VAQVVIDRIVRIINWPTFVFEYSSVECAADYVVADNERLLDLREIP